VHSLGKPELGGIRGRGGGQARTSAVRDPAGHRRPGGDARARARLSALSWSRVDRGCAGTREDADDQDDRRRARWLVPARAVHARPRAVGSGRHRVYRPDRADFETELGPVFCNFLLADEINRAPAKVQSALLEVMQEQQVTIGHKHVPGSRAVPRARHAEPDRVRGHLPAPRGAGRPLHAEDPGRTTRATTRSSPSFARLARGGAGSSRKCSSSKTSRVSRRRRRRIYVDPALISWAVDVATATRRPADHGLGR